MGLPVSHPAIQALTEDQWLFMSHAFRLREEREHKRVAALLEATQNQFINAIIYLFGLHLGLDQKEGAKILTFRPLVSWLALGPEGLAQEARKQSGVTTVDQEKAAEVITNDLEKQLDKVELALQEVDSEEAEEKKKEARRLLNSLGVIIKKTEE